VTTVYTTALRINRPSIRDLRRDTIAKNQNTFAKRQREMEKKFKAQDKLNRRLERKAAQDAEPVQPPIDSEEIPDELN